MKTDLEALAAGGNGGSQQPLQDEDPQKWLANHPQHDPETGEIISDEMAAKAKHEAALSDPTGDMAGELLKEQLDERAVTGTAGSTSMYDKERAKLAAKTNK
jgi:hypothetical protein